MFENIQLAFQGVFGHKLRSFLTMLGIIIGIASIITIISTIKGTNEQIKQNLIGSGSNIVNVQLYQNDWAVDMSYQTPDGIRAARAILWMPPDSPAQGQTQLVQFLQQELSTDAVTAAEEAEP